MACLSLSLLGPFAVTLDGQPVSGFVSNKVRALLAYLAVESDRPHRRDLLAALLWPDWPDASARRNLRNALANLRVVVGDRDADGTEPGDLPHLLISRESVQFNAAGDHRLDVAALRAAVEVERPDAERLEDALALYRGPFLEGFSVGDSAAYEEWTLRVREALERLALSALERLVVGYEEQGEIERAIDAARRQVALAPWHESAHRELMRLLALDGQRSAALAQYEACRRLLEQELGVEPSAETARLAEGIREGRVGPSAPEPRSPSRPRAAEALAPRRNRPPSNVPLPATPLVGRETQLAQVHALLARPEVRLLTLTGVGGTGKTRLALEVAAEAVSTGPAAGYRDGVCWVSLAPLHDPGLVAPTIAAALGVRESGDTPLLDTLKRALRDGERLLVLDNLEQVLAGSASGLEALLGALLAAAPRLKVLATSRVPLHVYGEHEYPVPPLEVPHLRSLSLERLAQVEAISLFVHCALRVRPGFCLDEGNAPAVAEICARLDGLPLAIELAAARVKLFDPPKMLSHLGASEGARAGGRLRFLAGGARNAPARQRTLRAAIEWSDDLLTAHERALFYRLSVFAGGCTLEAAGAVCEDPLSALDLLEALVDQSLLQVSPSTPPRFVMLGTMRDYAWERLQARGEADAVRAQHAAHYAAALSAWEAGLKGDRQLEALAEIEADLDNARAAYEWAIEGVLGGSPRRAHVGWLDDALEGLCLFYEWRGRYAEGKAVCQAVIDGLSAHRPEAEDLGAPVQEAAPTQDAAQAEAPGPAPGRVGAADDEAGLHVLARALAWQSRLGRALGQLSFADRCFEQALALLGKRTSSGLDAQRAFVLLGLAERASGSDPAKARRLARRSLAGYRALGDPWGMARAILHLGRVAYLLGEYGEMRSWLEEGLALSHELGDRRGILWALLGLGFSVLHIGRLDEGEQLARQALAAAREAGDPELVRAALTVLYAALHDGGRFEEARAVREQDLALCRAQTLIEAEIEALSALGDAARHQGDHAAARDFLREALSLGVGSRRRQTAARCAMGLGCLALAEGAGEEAERWLRQALALHAQVGRNWQMGELWSALAYLACAQGRPAKARGHLLTALRIVAESRHRNAALQSLAAMALLLLDAGARAAPDVERAVELYALAARHPYVANSRWFEDVAGRALNAAAEALPPEAAAAARERGRARELWPTVEALLDELEG